MGKWTYLAYLLQFGILHMGFSTIFFNYFVKLRKEYATFMRTLGSMTSVLLGGGANFKPGVAAGDDEFARFWVIVFAIVMTFTFTNVFISIVCDMIAGANEDLGKLQENIEFDPIDYLGEKFKELKTSVDSLFILVKKEINVLREKSRLQKANKHSAVTPLSRSFDTLEKSQV